MLVDLSFGLWVKDKGAYIMNKEWVRILAVMVIAGLSGCSSDSGTSGTTTSTGAAPSGTTVSGNTFSFDGIWKGTCYASNGTGSSDMMDTITFAGATVNVAMTSYTSTNLSCTGTATAVGNMDLSITAGATEAITGWVDQFGNVATAPAAKDGSGPLATTASFTQQTAIVTAVSAGLAGSGIAVGNTFDVSKVVDNTGLPIVAYSINYTAGASTAIVDDFLTKQ